MTCDLWAALRRSRLLRDESGATAIEYALIAGLVCVAIVAGLSSIGNDIGPIFNSVSNSLVPAN